LNKINIKTPAYVCEERLLRKNLEILKDIKEKSGAKILLALKGFAMFSTFGLVSKYLDGCCASGLYEAKLAKEEFKKEVHTYSPAFSKDDIVKIAQISDHIVFNSVNQLNSFYDLVKSINKNISIGIRVNPEKSLSVAELYNPCGAFSRLGVTKKNFDKTILDKIDGLHFHALCEQGSEALEEVLKSFENNFSKFFPKLKWVNFGGGHHITKKGYNKKKLINLIKNFKAKYNNIEVYLEPGEAIGWEVGFLVATVLDIVENGIKIAILDVSAEAHMPETIIMPYTPKVRGADKINKKKYNYRLGGNSCLSGDIMGDYSFDKELKIGDQVIFEDQIHYTFVKNTTFNGINLPSLVIKRENGEIDIIKEFGYLDYKGRLS